ncbi:DUF72 domain-containing protein [Chromatiaceae bacterium AAb-1]|nr:DUF72 domain-containing protein [Chromatiaceae bacterium AAb-1]
MLYLGCPMWANAKWKKNLYPSSAAQADFLAHYSRYFNSVEGNTTFYASPSVETIKRWAEISAADFRFTLKVPQTVTHHNSPEHLALLQQWLTLVAHLREKLAIVHLQLPASFGPQQLPLLATWLAEITAGYHCAVEVRHPAFFDKGEHEIALHRLLQQYNAERVVFDSRALFSVAATDAAIAHAQSKKPRLPVHAISFTSRPMLRFIGLDDMNINRQFYQPWLGKIRQWLDAGKTPYCFFHTPDNILAPELCRQFVHDLGIQHSCCELWPGEQQTQPALF